MASDRRQSRTGYVLGGALLLLGLADPAQAAFAYRRLITIDGTRVVGVGHSSFPVLVSVQHPDLRTAPAGHVQSASGNDIAFMDSSAGTALDHEIERYDGATGTLVAWVRLPSLSGPANTTFFMYYGDPEITCPRNAPVNVWSGYRYVYHLGETAGNPIDSTANGIVATRNPNGDATAVETLNVAGKIGSALDLTTPPDTTAPPPFTVGPPATDTHVEVADGTLAANSAFTMEGWVRFDTLPPTGPSGWVGVLAKGRETGTNWIGIDRQGLTGVATFTWPCCGFGPDNLDGTTVLGTGTWYYLAVTFDGTSQRAIYVNGVAEATSATAFAYPANARPTRVGDDSSGNYVDGQVDEVRFYPGLARSVSWIQTTFNNHDSPATFLTMAAEQVVPTNYRSIGTAANYTTGSVNLTTGSRTVTGTGTAWLGANRGRGDSINVNSGAFVGTILSVDSNIQTTLVSPSTITGTFATYSISRKFATLTEWEDCIDGGSNPCGPDAVIPLPDFVAADRREVGIVYRDGPAYARLAISGHDTGRFHDITLTADAGNRHTGVAGTGVVIDNTTALAGLLVTGGDTYLTVEWLEVTGGLSGAFGIQLGSFTAINRVVIRNNIVHDVPSNGFHDSDTDHKVEIYDNLFYNTGGYGIAFTNGFLHSTQSNIRILNNTVYNPTLDGIFSATAASTTVTVANNISWGSPAPQDDFNVPGAGSFLNNLSSDATGTGPTTTVPLTGVGGVNFISTGLGVENLHLTTGTSPASAAANAGTSLSCFLQRDIDNAARVVPWDIGADEVGGLAGGGCSGLSTSSTATTITVETPEVEMVWDNAAGGGLSELYGKTEPNSLVSRRGGGAGSYNVFSTQLNNGGWIFERTAGGSAHLLEATATRVRIRQNYNYTGQIHLDRDWSIYAYPRLAIDETLVFDVDQANLRGAQGLHPKGEAACGGANTFFCAGQSIEASGIWLTTDNGPGYSDMLAIADTTPFFARPASTYNWDNFLEPGTPNTRLARVHESDAPFTTTMGSYLRNYLFYPYLAGLTSGGTEWQLFANDYRSPDVLSFNFSVGTGWEDANENTGPGDFFNDAEAAYAVDINPVSGLSVNINGNTTNHPKPFFKIRQWRSLGDPPSVTRDLTPLVNGVDYQADLKPVARAYFCTPGCVEIAHGGLVGHANEYLADTSGARNFPLNFTGLNYLYLGVDSKFRGLNFAFAVLGAGTATLRWEYFNGVSWLDLGGASGFTDQTNNLKKNGTIYWGSDALELDPIGWAPTSVNGSPQLFFVRARLDTGSYTPTPVEGLIKTDILLFQYCGNVVALDETFVFGPPVPTAVTLSSFTAMPRDAAVDLSWSTASELQNLGFHVYRADAAAGPYNRLTPSLIPGLGSSPTGRSYSYRDSALVNGRTYYYQLEDIETTGRTARHGPVSATPGTAAGPCCSSPPSTSPGPSGTSYGDPSSVVLREVERSARHVVLELRTGGFLASPAEEGRVSLRIPGFESASRPGEPSLPMRRALVEAAAGRKVRLTSVQASDEVRFPGLRPVAQGAPEIEVSEEGVVLPSEEKRRDGPGFEGLFPEESALLLGGVFQGETKKAEVLLFPLRWDGSGLTLSRRLLVRLEFTGVEGQETSRGGSRGRRRVERARPARSGVVAQIAVKERGLYRVDYDDVFPPTSRRPRGMPGASLRLSRQGESVVFHLEPAGMPFAPGSSLYFLSEGSSLNPYADAVYELQTNAGGLLMEEKTLSPMTSGPVGEYLETVRKEENYYYQAGLLEAPDLWLWDIVISPESKAFAFTTDQVAASSTAGRLTAVLQGVSDFPGVVDHHVKVRVNGVFVGEVTWDGATERTLEMKVPPEAFLEGANSLSLENVGDTGASYSMVFLNRFSVSYPRRLVAVQGTLEGGFETTGPAEIEGALASSFVIDTTEIPRWLTGASATPTGLSVSVEAGKSYLVTSSFLRPTVKSLAPSGLRSRTNQADYLLLGPQAFLPAAQPLLDLRESQGLVTKAVSLEEIYERFGHGEVSPEAIKEFLEYAYHFWAAPSPRYVLLLGDASYDPRDHLGTGVKDWLPGFPVRTSYLWTVSDPAYASVNGDDLLPDLAIGRLSAASVDEAQRLVQKVVAFENGGGHFDGPAVLVSDNADLAGNFEANADEIAATVLAPRNPKKIYYSVEGANTRTKIREAFDDGASLMSYIGHGSTVAWASENFFNYLDAPSLVSQPQQPLLLTLNCLNGFFHFPPLNSLAEALLKAEGKGVVAAFSPSGLSVNDPAHLFHKALLGEIVSGRHQRIGDAVLAAQEAYAQTGAFPELLSIYHLFGDPALRIQ